MQSIAAWPLIHRNKVEDSGIEGPVKRYTENDNETIRTMAERVRSTGISTV